jgi:hypothetical protein
MSKEQVDHYAILFQDERKTQYTVFASTDLNTLGAIFAQMLQFEEMFRTFPNASCHLRLEKDYNYDPDLGAFRMDALPFGESHKWGILVDDIIHNYGTVLDSPRR